MDEIPSPCTGQCHLDDKGWCAGCGRTPDEIECWPAATAERRRQILARLAGLVRCSACGAPFPCSGDPSCWCMAVEMRMPMPNATTSCWCPTCLAHAAATGRPAACGGAETR